MIRTLNIQPGYVGGVLLVMLAGLFWSFIPTVVRQFESASILQILLYRSIGVIPMVALLMVLSRGTSAFRVLYKPSASVVIGALGLVAAYAGGIGAVRMTSIANAAFLFAAAPFLAAILGRIVLGERIRTSTLVAIFFAMLGILIMVYDNFTAGNWLGDVVAAVSALGFAVFAVALRAGSENDTLAVVLIGAVFSALFAFGSLSFTGAGIQVPQSEVVMAVSLGFLVLGVGMVLFTFGASVVPAAELALLAMVEVVLAPVWAWLFLSEIPTRSALLGGAILIGAIVFNALSGIRRKPAPLTF
ncbi:MAG: DMT family transporter [Pseudomonadota bacterium]